MYTREQLQPLNTWILGKRKGGLPISSIRKAHEEEHQVKCSMELLQKVLRDPALIWTS